MAIVQNIIEQHDGRIFASNVKPHGAMVTHYTLIFQILGGNVNG
jgi:signal transduction histidine kinase